MSPKTMPDRADRHLVERALMAVRNGIVIPGRGFGALQSR